MRGLSQGCEKSVSADPPPSREPDSGRPDSGLGDAWRGAEALILGTGDEAGARIRDLRHAMEVCGARVTTRLRPLFPEGGRDRLGALAFGRGLLRLPSLHRALLEALPPAPPDIIIIPYPGHLDAPALAPRLRERYGPKTRIALDLFVGLHETLVLDRARVPVGSWRAGALLGLDRRAAASVDILITDTREHGRLWTDSGIIARGGSDGGAEPVVVRLGGDPRLQDRGLAGPISADPPGSRLELVHVGSHIPLHGGDVMLAALTELQRRGAASSTAPRSGVTESAVRTPATMPTLTMIGEGRRRAPLERAARQAGLPVVFEPSLPFEAMRARLRSAALVLGTFGRGVKAEAVVPQKVLDALACGRPLITSDTAPQRRACADGEAARLVPPGDPDALADAISAMACGATRARYASAARRAFEEWSEPRRRLAALGRRFRDHGRVKTEP